ncbi:MAG: DUF4416 family protein [Candidatus Abyssobacteria bacterium SURF_5]|uniref:DUF4416 family protein n=1 Tax=Abyssobacteria bacterium (strain SURF_5) TaxID=2093360 RepID=A0A3A4NFV7_ABYX5|nr:MAG: DUF4416 family protein [Candidatus Abyssubacteria bacterium SURF_5]
MGQVQTPRPVKLLVGMLAGSPALFAIAEKELIQKFGAVDVASELIPFDFTNYYAEEMGPNLLRKFVAFESLINPKELAPAKLYTNEVEREISQRLGSERRLINLDPGYIALSKLVLASTKDYSHRIYLGDGIFAEVTLHYANRRFNPWPWTYPDYKTEAYLHFFESVRSRYLETLKRVGV